MAEGGIPATLRVLREEVRELRADGSAASEALAAILHKLDQILAILQRRRRSKAARKKL